MRVTLLDQMEKVGVVPPALAVGVPSDQEKPMVPSENCRTAFVPRTVKLLIFR